MLYRDYRPEDRQTIGAVHDAARKTELRLAGLEEAFLPLEIAGEREGLFAYPGLFVAEDGGRVRGFAACTEEELAWLYVNPEHMRRGIGRSLVEFALARFPGIRTVEVLVGNTPARALYEKEGFCLTGLEKGRMRATRPLPWRYGCCPGRKARQDGAKEAWQEMLSLPLRGSVGSAPGGARSGPGRNSAGHPPRRRACGTRCAPRIPRNHGSGGQQAALPGAGGFPGGKTEPKQKALSIGKGACIRFGCTPLRFRCVTGSDPLHTALWACFRPPVRLRAQPSGRVLLPRGCRPASRSTLWRSPGTGRS